MQKQNQWLFEMPLSSEVTCRCKYCSTRSSYSNVEQFTDLQAPAVVLRSPQFRGDSRLQSAANNRPPMRPKEQGHAVQKLQQALIDLGFPMPITARRGIPDGIYGSETISTVRKFQMKYGLQVDGVVGKETLNKLDQLFSPSIGWCFSLVNN